MFVVETGAWIGGENGQPSASQPAASMAW
jgi:hypothetical protein